MLHSPELAGLVQARLIRILKVSKSLDINNMILTLIRDMKEHMEQVPTHRCYSCGYEVKNLELYCRHCMGTKRN